MKYFQNLKSRHKILLPRILLLVLLCMNVFITYGQTSFTYDASGNRLAKIQIGNNGGKPCPKANSTNGRLGTSDTMSVSAMTLYPNPSSGQVMIYFNLTQWETATLSVASSTGIEVFSRQVQGTGDNQLEKVDLYNSLPGLYIVRLKRTNGVSLTSRLLIVRD